MKLKKIMCTAMAGAMALSLAATALAANEEDSLAQNVEVSGTTQTPTISIVVPDESSIVLNPYKMTVKVKDGALDASGDEVSDQIISAVNYVTNKTDVALNVSASVTGKIESPSKVKPVFATTSTASSAKPLTTKSVFMYFEAVPAADNSSTPDWEEGYDAKATNQILVAAKATAKTVATLEATDGSTANYLAFRFNGDMVTAPTEAWAETDVVGASIAFTFTPTVVEE